MDISRKGCFISMLIVAAMLLAAAWVFGAFAVHPVHCSGPECERWARQLDRSMLSSYVGVGCLVLAALHWRTKLWLWLGVGVLGITALAGMPNPGMAAVVAINVLLVAAVGGWYLAGGLDAWQ